MARIRTIKPEFFTSEDIVQLSPLARLLYVALWCEADKEGRLVWKPATFKLRYLPGDEVDVVALGKELTDAGLVALYGNGYAHIPTFKAHQHINPRETASQLPDPPDPNACPTPAARVGTRQARAIDAQGGREGKVKEGDIASPGGDDRFAEFWATWPKSERKQDKGKCRELWRAKGLDAAADAILADVRAKLGTSKWRDRKPDGGDFIEAPERYLRNRRWEDGNVNTGESAATLPRWCRDAGFENVHEARNAGCFEHNAREFSGGARRQGALA